MTSEHPSSTPDEPVPEDVAHPSTPSADDQLADSLALDESFEQPDGLVDMPPAASPEPRPRTEPAGDAAEVEADGATAAPSAKKSKKRGKSPWWELPLLIAIAVVVAMLIKSFMVQPFYIPSESMEKTLHGCTGCAGDRILVNKPIYHLRDPHPGDIVVFKAPDHWDNEPIPQAPSNPILKSAWSRPTRTISSSG
jgi:signal peptidase I